MTRSLAYALLAACAFATSAAAAPAPAVERIRGTITSVDGMALHVRTRTGKDEAITLAPDTHYGSLSKATLADVKAGTFIGTATKGSGDFITALEVVVFPDAMRGTGEGHYPWDKIADTTQGGRATASSMTNGTIASAVPASAGAMTNSSMTNGNVATSSGEGGAQKLTVTYKDPKTGQAGQQTIIVPPTAPVVMIAPADKSVLVSGGKVFLVAAEDGGKLEARLVAVGKDGLTPPM